MVASAFPAAYAAIPTPTLVEVYEAGPRQLRLVLDGLGVNDLRARPRPGKWSILETALHLCDSEVAMAFRMRLVYATPGATLTAYDQDAFAARFRYQDADEEALRTHVHQFACLRATTARWLRGAGPEELARSGMHTERGPLTLRQLLELAADHSERHVEQIAGMRAALGKPGAVPRLLDRRLY